MIWPAKNQRMNANATFTNLGLALTVMWEPIAEPTAAATVVTASNTLMALFLGNWRQVVAMA